MIQEFTQEGTTILWEDCFTALREKVADWSVDLIFADPPYNIGKNFGGFKDSWPSDEEYARWCQGWLELCISKLKPCGTMYIMASTQSMPFLDLFVRKRIAVLSRIVWHYDSSSTQARSKFGSMYEPILHCVKNPEAYTFNGDAIRVEAKTGARRRLIDYRKPVPAQYNTTKVPGNAWYFARVRYRMDEYENHPSQKPEALLERIILASSNPGELVLDPFSGTFTTSAVAKRLGRRSIGIEREVEYVKVGLRRLRLASIFDGEELRSLDKRYVRRNSKARMNGAVDAGLFE